jgi:hypothetical protein
MSPRNNVKAQYLTGDGKATKELEDACWLQIGPAGESLGVIEVGNRNHDNSLSAVTFAVDQYRFGKYDGPGTDFEAGIHVYASAEGKAYVEDGATIMVDGEWWAADVIKPNGKVTLKPAYKLDPVDHTTEIISRMQDRGADLDRQKAATANEAKRARWHKNRIDKHTWGMFFGYTFKIWFAHKRSLAEHYMKIVNEKDDAVAAALRSDGINESIEYREHILPVIREVRRQQATQATDAPDLPEGMEKEPEPVEALVMTFVDDKGLKVQSVDLMQVQAGAGVTIWYQTNPKRAYKEAKNAFYTWDPEDPKIVDVLRGFAKEPGFGVNFSVQFLPK